MNVASVAYANYFGRAHVGGITGVATSALVFGSAAGPFPFGLVRDCTGSFALAFVGSALLSLVLAAMVLVFANPPMPIPSPQQDVAVVANDEMSLAADVALEMKTLQRGDGDDL